MGYKRCKYCGTEKPEEMFRWGNRSKSRELRCKACRNEHSKAYYKIPANKKRQAGNHRRLRKRNSDFKNEYLQKHPCVDCGESDVLVLEFDHVRGEKKYGIGGMNNSIAAMITEIKKCEVRCANCHKRRHAGAG